MTVFKCKMCGGTLEINVNKSVAVCEYCGTKQTLPKLDNERRTNMYDRANHYRRHNEFDKAAGVYEQILNEDKTDAEAYWSLVLCRYGVEYVEDPQTRKRVPTIHRTQNQSIFLDGDYQSAVQYADEFQCSVYEAEAMYIDNIQKNILEISRKEEPYDVFICYKETDRYGERTKDSVLAYDLYEELTDEGVKVFFSRVTLEDKLGTAYEPYIFAALNSAKVMVVLGTSKENFNAIWVKNEWNRFLLLIKNGEEKTLIPAYTDMDPYDLPEEFSYLQAQDMSKLGYMQDMVRGIKKIIADGDEVTEVGEVTPAYQVKNKVEPLLERMWMFLKDGEWENADKYCERVLDVEPKNSQAYIGKLMASEEIHRFSQLARSEIILADDKYFKRALSFAAGDYQKTLKELRSENIYEMAFRLKRRAQDPDEYLIAAKFFARIRGYSDADVQQDECKRLADESSKQSVYNEAKGKIQYGSDGAITQAIKYLDSISGFKDASELSEKLKQERYDKAQEGIKEGTSIRINRAITLLETIPDFKDSSEQIKNLTEKIKKVKRKEVITTGAVTFIIIIIMIMCGFLSTRSRGKADRISAIEKNLQSVNFLSNELERTLVFRKNNKGDIYEKGERVDKFSYDIKISGFGNVTLEIIDSKGKRRFDVTFSEKDENFPTGIILK